MQKAAQALIVCLTLSQAAAAAVVAVVQTLMRHMALVLLVVHREAMAVVLAVQLALRQFRHRKETQVEAEIVAEAQVVVVVLAQSVMLVWAYKAERVAWVCRVRLVAAEFLEAAVVVVEPIVPVQVVQAVMAAAVLQAQAIRQQAQQAL